MGKVDKMVAWARNKIVYSTGFVSSQDAWSFIVHREKVSKDAFDFANAAHSANLAIQKMMEE